VNTVISPVTLILTPIPGPNLLGYWIAYRAFCHLLAVLGARGAEELIDSTTLNPEVYWTNLEQRAVNPRFQAGGKI